MIIGIYIALQFLLFVTLSVNVIRGWLKNKAAQGDKKKHDMRGRTRALSNFTKDAPIFLFMLSILEYYGSSMYVLHLLGVLFSASSVSQAYDLSFPKRSEDGSIKSALIRTSGMWGNVIALMISVILLINHAIKNFEW